MTLTLSRNHRYFIITNLFLLGMISVFVLKKLGRLDDFENLKFFGSRLLYLYLVGWCSVFLTFFYEFFSSIYKKWAWGLIGLFYVGMLGIIVNPYPKIDIMYLNAQLETIKLTKNKDKIHAKVKFINFDPHLKEFLEKAKQGKIKAFIRTDFFLNFCQAECSLSVKNEILNHQGSKFDLSPKIIDELLVYKEMKIDVSTKYTTEVVLNERDYRKISVTRKDELFVNNSRIKLSHDNVLNVPFYFETLEGKPLTVFY